MHLTIEGKTNKRSHFSYRKQNRIETRLLCFSLRFVYIACAILDPSAAGVWAMFQLPGSVRMFCIPCCTFKVDEATISNFKEIWIWLRNYRISMSYFMQAWLSKTTLLFVPRDKLDQSHPSNSSIRFRIFRLSWFVINSNDEFLVITIFEVGNFTEKSIEISGK